MKSQNLTNIRVLKFKLNWYYTRLRIVSVFMLFETTGSVYYDQEIIHIEIFSSLQKEINRNLYRQN